MCYDLPMLSVATWRPQNQIDFFGLGAADTVDPQKVIVMEEEVLQPIFAPKSRGARIIAPVIPENMPLKCRFDPVDGMWRCSYETWWRQPSVYTIGILALAAFGFGFLMGSSAQLRKAVKEAREAVPL